MKKIFIIMIFLGLLIPKLSAESIEDIQEMNLKEFNFKMYAKCSQVLHDYHQVKCYSYNKKETTVTAYYLDSNVSKNNLKYRTSYFRIDKRIPKEFKHDTKCYKNNPLDQGHLLPDASMDDTLEHIKGTYINTNIIPEYEVTNRRSILHVEREVRKIAEKQGIIVVVGSSGFDKYMNDDINCPMIPKFIYTIVFTKDEKNDKHWKPYKIYYVLNDGVYKVYEVNPELILFNIIY